MYGSSLESKLFRESRVRNGSGCGVFGSNRSVIFLSYRVLVSCVRESWIYFERLIHPVLESGYADLTFFVCDNAVVRHGYHGRCADTKESNDDTFSSIKVLTAGG